MNLPNKISLSRIILLPVFLAVGIIAFPYNNFVAMGMFILLAVTDFVDGYIARKYNMVTNLGKFLDTIADKLLCTTALLLLIVGNNPIIPHPFGIICAFLILLRDYAVTALRQIAQLKNVIIAADKFGKIKANFQYVMTAFGFLIGGLAAIDSVADTTAFEWTQYIFYGVVAITTLLVIISGISYFIKNGKVFVEEKSVTDTKTAKPESESTENSEETTVSVSITRKTSNKKTTTKKK
jgi:CDP-diacylglycerol--glycerol-3-phosphate 3-phosphatidyltransferase